MGLGFIGDLRTSLAEKLNAHITNAGRKKATRQKLKNVVKAKKGAKVEQNFTIINIGTGSDQEKEEALELLRDSFNKGELLFVEDESKKLAEGIKAAESDDQTADTVNFFKGKLSSLDWQIMRTGIYIDYLVKQGQPTQEIRTNVIRTHGRRGNNLMNLASAGHFESHIRPLYEELSKSPDFTRELFDKEFNRILDEMPFALFVNSTTSIEELKKQIETRCKQASDYSVYKRKIYIHGWGANVNTIEECLEQLDEGLKIRVSSNKRKEVVEIIDVEIEF